MIYVLIRLFLYCCFFATSYDIEFGLTWMYYNAWSRMTIFSIPLVSQSVSVCIYMYDCVCMDKWTCVCVVILYTYVWMWCLKFLTLTAMRTPLPYRIILYIRVLAREYITLDNAVSV